MPSRPITPLTRAVWGVLLAAVAPGTASLAQPANRPSSNISTYDARSGITVALPVPPVPSGSSPRAFLFAARDAVQGGRTGEAQEALERAETRLLDRRLPASAAVGPDRQHAVLAIAAARAALAARDPQAAITAIDYAFAATDPSRPHVAALPLPTVMAPASSLPLPHLPPPPQPPQDPQQVITRALLPGHWALDGARYVWAAPETTLRRVQATGLVPGAYLWRDGAYEWVPAHYQN